MAALSWVKARQRRMPALGTSGKGFWACVMYGFCRPSQPSCRHLTGRIRDVDSPSPASSSISKVVSKSAVRDQVDEVVYWVGVSLEERVGAVEVLRRRMYGRNDGVRPGLQRVCRITRSA